MAEEEVDLNSAELGNALAEHLGIKAEERSDPEVDRFLGSDAAEETHDAPVKAKTTEWVHEPTGKVFESELDMLRYESGWKTQQYGERLKKLEDRSEPKEEKTEAPKALSRDEMKRMVLPNLSEDDLKDPLVDIVFDGAMNVAELSNRVAMNHIAKLEGVISELASKFETAQERSASGIDQAKEDAILQEYPELKALPLRDRLSVLKRIDGQRASATQALTPAQKAEKYVEGSSARSEVHEEGDFLKRFDDIKDDRAALNLLGGLFERSKIMNV